MKEKLKSMRDFGVTLMNPAITEDINRRLYSILLRRDPEKAQRFKEYRDQFDRAAAQEVHLKFPLHIIVEALYGCNYRCPQCLLGIEEMRRKYGGQGVLSMDDYKRIIDEAALYKTPSILLNGVNEPLLDKHLFERIEYARDNGFVDIQLHSNGELLNEEACHRLITAGCTRLMISLDAFSTEVFSKIRVGGNYETVLANIQRFLEIRQKRMADLPVFRVSFVRQKFNEHEIQPFIDYWTKRADYVHLQTYMEMLDTRHLNFYPAAETDILGSFHCEQPWYSMFIRPKGDVLPCCSFWNYELKVGNGFEKSLHDIWNSAPYHELRALHKRGEYRKNPICAKCVKGMFPAERA